MNYLEFTEEYQTTLKDLRDIYKTFYQPNFEMSLELYSEIISKIVKLWEIHQYVPPCLQSKIFDTLTIESETFNRRVEEKATRDLVDEHYRFSYENGERRKRSYVKVKEGVSVHDPIYQYYKEHSHDGIDPAQLYFVTDIDSFREMNQKWGWIAVPIHNIDTLSSLLDFMNIEKEKKYIQELYLSWAHTLKYYFSSNNQYVLTPISFYSFWISQNEKNIYFAERDQELASILSILPMLKQKTDVLTEIVTLLFQMYLKNADKITSLSMALKERSERCQLYVEGMELQSKIWELRNIKAKMYPRDGREFDMIVDGRKAVRRFAGGYDLQSKKDDSIVQDLQYLKEKEQKLEQKKLDLHYRSTREKETQHVTYDEVKEAMESLFQKDIEQPLFNYSPLVFSVQGQSVIVNFSFGYEMNPIYFDQKGLTPVRFEDDPKLHKIIIKK